MTFLPFLIEGFHIYNRKGGEKEKKEKKKEKTKTDHPFYLFCYGKHNYNLQNIKKEKRRSTVKSIRTIF